LRYYLADAERNAWFVRNELAQLRAHLGQCVLALGPLHRFGCVVEALDAFLLPRFVSVVAVVTAMVVVVAALSN
jgi:hypothetical protein